MRDILYALEILFVRNIFLLSIFVFYFFILFFLFFLFPRLALYDLLGDMGLNVFKYSHEVPANSFIHELSSLS